MSSAFPYNPAIFSYGLAALIFAGFAVQFSVGWRGGLRASVLVGAVVASAIWASCVLAVLIFPIVELWWLARFLDAIRLGVWLAFLLLLLKAGRNSDAAATGPASLAWPQTILCALLLGSAILPQSPPWLDTPAGEWPVGAFVALLSTSVFGLVLSEQLYRRTPENGRWAIKPLLIGLSGMFAFDLLTYSGAILFSRIDPAMWAARGIAHALVMIFVALATKRNTAWTIDWHVSRGVVFHSTALFVAGIYLLIVAAAGYWVRLFGGGWGETLQIAFVFAALLCLGALALSGRLRAWLKVFISKHFFSFRYEYRGEWLRFTRALGTPAQGVRLYEQVVRALADLVESIGGAIWLEREGTFHEVARLNLPIVRETEPASGPLVAFLNRTGWVISLDEVAAFPDRYPQLVLPEWLAKLKEAWLVIPLPSGVELIGFVVLARPRAPTDVNWEVLDLLKTAGRQAASYLAHMRANEALVEAEKFDAFNRMSAFVVHDLKNLIAQLALLLKNAERHRDNPEFQRDMLETIEHVVGRMNHLMLQLRTGTTPMEKPRPVELREVIERVIKTKEVHRALIDVEPGSSLRAFAHDDRIERVLGHIVQNAIEATREGGGRIRLRAFPDGTYAVIEIVDNGVGMTEEFVRERLFRPYQTTKSKGMGIGMYESFRYINGIGGRITVNSSPNGGTRFQVFLPLADNEARSSEPPRHAA